MERVDELGLFLIFQESHSVSLHFDWSSLVACCMLPISCFLMLLLSLFSPRSLFWRQVGFFSEAFSASSVIIMCFIFFFSLFIWWLHWWIILCWITLASLEWSLLDHGRWYFDVFLVWLASILLSVIVSMFMRGLFWSSLS